MELQRFILADNLRYLREHLLHAPVEIHPQMQQMIVVAERELALFDAGQRGARNPWDRDDDSVEAARSQTLDWFRGAFADSLTPATLIDPRPGLMIVAVNPASAAATGVTPADIAGRPLFVTYPDSAENPLANGVANLYASLRRVAETGVAETMPVQRYDTREPGGGPWRERYWRIENSAITDGYRRLVYLLLLAVEVDGPD